MSKTNMLKPTLGVSSQPANTTNTLLHSMMNQSFYTTGVTAPIRTQTGLGKSATGQISRDLGFMTSPLANPCNNTQARPSHVNPGVNYQANFSSMGRGPMSGTMNRGMSSVYLMWVSGWVKVTVNRTFSHLVLPCLALLRNSLGKNWCFFNLIMDTVYKTRNKHVIVS